MSNVEYYKGFTVPPAYKGYGVSPCKTWTCCMNEECLGSDCIPVIVSCGNCLFNHDLEDTIESYKQWCAERRNLTVRRPHYGLLETKGCNGPVSTI